jgi:uncharacterized protein
MVVRTVVHFEIPADDVRRLSVFYRRVFGWTFDRAGVPGLEYWRITTGPPGKSVGGGMFRRSSPNERPRNFVCVDRIDRTIAAFLAAGGTELTGKMEVPGMGTSFVGEDPEGNVIALWEPTRTRARRPPARGAAPRTRGRRGR